MVSTNTQNRSTQATLIYGTRITVPVAGSKTKLGDAQLKREACAPMVVPPRI